MSDETDRVLCRRRLPNDLPAVLGLLEPYRGDLAGVVVESTYNWYWLVDGLQAAGYEVRLANTSAIKQYEGLKHGDDDSDAAHLAQLLRLGILPTGYIEAAHFACRYCPEAKRFYERKKARTSSIVATKALAHKLARACYHMMKENQPFDVKRCFA